MNNRYGVFVFTVFLSVFSFVQGFEDQPALTTLDLALRKVSKASGLVVGSAVGQVAGMAGGAAIGQAAARHNSLRQSAKTLANQDPQYAQLNMAAAQGYADFAGLGGALFGGVGGAAVLSAPAGYIGYKGGGFVALHILAKQHGVSYRVEKVSQFYNINLMQYGSLLIAAEKKASYDYLNKIVDQIYSQRFGADWKNELKQSVSLYQPVEGLFTNRSQKLDQSAKDYIRMMELGAAMANLFFNSKPEVKNITKNAILMYQKLGLL